MEEKEKQQHHEKQDVKLARRLQDAESKAPNISPQPYPENSQLLQDEEMARQLQDAEMAQQSKEADDPRDNEPSNESK